MTVLAASSPAGAQSLGGVGGTGLNPGGNGGGSNQNGGNGSTGATFGAKGVAPGGAGQPGTTGMGPMSANASGGGGGGGAVGNTTTAGGAGGAGGAGVGNTPGGGGGGGGGGGTGYNSSFANSGTLTLTGGAGGVGGAGSGIGGGGGGGGGGFGVVTGADINNSGTLTVTAGAGGAGGAGGVNGAGGSGGAGGAGVQTSASFYNSALSTSSTVTGGAGGAGGTGAVGGVGGAGGVGILISGNGATQSTIVNQLGDSISGGAGGAGGSGAAAGAGGAGVSGSNMTIENLGAINGGGAADAIDFNGGTNTLSLGASQSMTGNVNVASGASLTIDQTIVGANGALSNALSGAGPVTITTGAYALTLSGDNTYTGGTTLTAGSTVIVGNTNALGTNLVTMNDMSSLNFTGGASISNAISISGDPDFSAATATTSVISGAITGSGSVTINNTAGDTGTIEFTSTGNAYTGTTTVEAGTLMGGVAGAFSAASATTVNAGAILDLGGFAQTINSVTLDQGTIQNGSLTGAISSAGGTVNGIGGSASLEATASLTPTMMEGSNTYTGATTVDSGATLSGAAGANVFSAVSATTVNGTLDLGGNDQAVGSLAGAGAVTNSGTSGTATLTNQGASSEFDGVIQDGGTAFTALTQNAPGNTLTLTGVNTYTGVTTVAGGTLALSGGGSIPNSSGVSLATGGIFDISQTTAGASIETLGNTAPGQTGTVYLGAQTLTLTGALTTFGGVIADAGGIDNVPGGGLTLGPTATGTETLTGVNAYTGATTIDAGTLALSGSGSIATSSGVFLSNNGTTGGTFDISATTAGASIKTLGDAGGSVAPFGSVVLGAQTLTITNGSTTFSGVIGGAGGLTVAGGVQTLAGVNAYTGATTIDGGATLALTGTGSVAASSGVVDNGTFDISGITNPVPGGTTITTLSGVSTAASVALGANTLTLSDASGSFAGVISGTGGLTLAATTTGVETLTGANTYSGPTTIQGGTLALAGGGSIANSGVSLATGATFDISQTAGGASIRTLGNTGAGQTGTVALGSKTLTLTGALTNFGGVIADGGIGGGTGGGLTLASTATGTETLSGVNTFTGLTTINGGTLAIAQTGALAGPVANSSVFQNWGSVAGLLTNNASGTTTNWGALNGGVLNSGAFTNSSGGVVTGGLTNSGTVNAVGGQINGGVDNRPKGVFAVGGAVSSNGAFLNESGATLAVTSGQYALAGLLTNAGAVTVGAGATLNAGAMGIVNLGSGAAAGGPGVITNYGVVYDDLTNAGAVMNYGVYNGNVAANTGAITNFGSGAWNGSAVNTGGTIENDGLWTGALTNMRGTLTNDGKIVGNVAAVGGTVNSFAQNSMIVGNVTLPGSPAQMNALGVITGNVNVMADSNGVYNGVFRVGDGSGLLNPVGSTPKTLTVNGSVSGPITMPVDLTTGNSNYIKVSGSTASAALSLTGRLTNPNNLLWTQVPNRTLLYSNASIPLTGASDELLAGASRYGLFNYVPTLGNDGIAQQLKLGVAASPANQISALITGLNTSFFQSPIALLSEPANPTANMWHGGVWARGAGGELTTETTSSGGGAWTSTDSRFQTSLGGIQLGIDGGLYNINASGINAHVGFTGGDAWGYSTMNRSSDPGALLNVSGSAAMPFYGVYAALDGRGFSGTVQWRHNNFNMNLNNTDLGLSGSELNANGNTFSAEAAYTLPLAYNFFVTPSAAVFVSNTGINDLYASPLVAPGSWFAFDNLNNTLLRAGLRVGTVYAFNDNLQVQPYVSGDFWHESNGSTTTRFYQYSSAGLSTLPGIYSTGVGSFGQFSVGFSTQSPRSGFTSFAQANFQTGSNLQGWGLTAGLRYSY